MTKPPPARPPARKSSAKEILRDVPLPPSEQPETSYKRLFETSQDGILVLDFETHRIVEANPGICLLTGLSRLRLIGADPESIAPLRALFQNGGSFFK